MLIVDDGSPDGTGEVVEEIAAAEPARPPAVPSRGRWGSGPPISPASSGRSSGTTTSCSRWMRTSRTIRCTSPQFLAAIENADLVLGSRYQQGRVTVVNWPIGAPPAELLREHLRPCRTGLPVWDATGGFKCFRRERARVDRPRSRAVERLRLPDRDELPGVEEALPHRRDSRSSSWTGPEGTSKMSKHIVREAVWMVWRLRWWALTGAV